MASDSNFSSVPVLDYSLIQRGRKVEFIEQLRHALVYVGFLYLSNPPVEEALVDRVKAYTPKFFDLPTERKERLAMRNSPHFFGYSRLGREFTKSVQDQREQFDFGTEHANQWTEGQPDWLRLWGSPQWPDDDELPGFRQDLEAYFEQLKHLSFEFTNLMEEALELQPGALDPFFDGPKELMQHRGKLVKYPNVNEVSSSQGVGPHYDSGFLTFLLQVSDLPGLQVQNVSGQWIDVLPKPNTLVVNIGKALEHVTQNVAIATSHRVISPPVGSPARYSVPFFQSISRSVRVGEIKLDIPSHILRLRDARQSGGDPSQAVNYAEYLYETSGIVALIGRIKSHPDVAEAHYPQLFRQIFPNGAPQFGSAY
ncbi:Clavaminate synthase-like protein [Cantharellus anzutake]|uniref:Clavaminate synthase-like protein n=1 Tax=Cantharellus anzutake TaxID=1750568 RepID=UPI001905D123|nr:Clavaminate synthase-like protein [Cantharellus anzutake]KAF8331392.1 Clavaminate synthase-like protein [Cantharellus anzutake]